MTRASLRSIIPHFLPEPLEGRRLLAVTLLDPATQPRFVNPLSVPAIAQPTSVSATGEPRYDIPVTQFQQDLGLINPATLQPMATTVWGYGGSYPGPTIEARRDQRISVRWINDLVRDPAADRTPLPPLLPVDTSVHWSNPLGGGVMSAGGGGDSTMLAAGAERYTGPSPIATHLHGGHTRADSDGHAEAWYTPDGPDADTVPDQTGRLYNEVYTYDNDQEPATLWYHDHVMGLSRLNVYAGLAGMYLLRGPAEDALNLPRGAYELPLLIQDRLFTAEGELYLPTAPPPGTTAPDPSIQPHVLGNVVLVNGKAWPSLEVEPRSYRFRIVNGSDSRYYTLSLPVPEAPGGAMPIYQIGTDGGLLDAPVTHSRITIGPGERADVVVDFSDPALAGQTLVLRNTASAPYAGPGGPAPDPNTVGQVMAFRVTRPLAGPDDSTLPAALRARPTEPLVQTGPTRRLALFAPSDEFGRTRFLLGTAAGGPMRYADPVSEVVRLNDVEVWEVRNNTSVTHTVHPHLVQFQILGRVNGSGEAVTTEFDAGWKDTVRVNPRETVRFIAKFDRPGEYMWHCHMLSHEDSEMMRPLRVVESVPAEVLGRNVFYNNSVYDGRSAAPEARDDGAVAADKQALLPMQTATFANVSSFSRGINGLFIDVRDLPAPPAGAAALGPDDFLFKAGLTGDPSTWPAGPAPSSITVRRGAGANGSDRVTLAWPDGAIRNKWLRVQVLANGRTGLTSPDVFYFGSLAGDTGNAPGPDGFIVNAQDLRSTRAKLFTRNAPLTHRHDFNRDRKVNALDVAVVRANMRATLPVLAAPHETGRMMAAALGPMSSPFAQGPLVPADWVPSAPTTNSTEQTGGCFCACGCCGPAHEMMTTC